MPKKSFFWKQVHAVTLANLKSRYRKTFAGFIWVLLSPMITFGVQGLVFSYFLKINVDSYLLFLVSGLIPWIFISQTLEMSTPVFVVSGDLMKSFSVSPLVYLSAQVLDNLINFIAGFILVLLFMNFWFGEAGWHLVFLPLPILVLSAGVFALSWIFATLQVFFRDTRFLIRFLMQISFFLTPVFYPREFIPQVLDWMVVLNPFFHLIYPFQVLIYNFNGAAFMQSMGVAVFVSLWLNAFALVLWDRSRNMVYFYV